LIFSSGGSYEGRGYQVPVMLARKEVSGDRVRRIIPATQAPPESEVPPPVSYG